MKNNNDNFIIFLTCSIILHLVIVYFFVFGLPSFFNKSEIAEEIIYFEMLPTKDISNIKNQKKSPEKAIENEEAKKVQKTQSEPVEEKKKPEEKPEEKKVEEKKIEENSNDQNTPDKLKEIIDIKKQEQPQKKEIKKEEKKQNNTKDKKQDNTKDKKKKKLSDAYVDSLLKTLEGTSEGRDNKSSKHSRSHSDDEENSKGNYDENLPLSVTEMSLIQKQIKDKWNYQAGAKDIDKIKIILSISLDQDGTVLDVQVIETICPFGVSDGVCNAVVNSAIIAVKKASPIANLSIDRYNVWKAFNLNLIPGNISR